MPPLKGSRLKREAREKLFTVSRAIVQYAGGLQGAIQSGLEIIKADIIRGIFALRFA